MADVLFIKTSSLGDVIHHMPAVTEARAHRPDARFAWVVEEAFAPLVRLHPAIDQAIPVAGRQWRAAPYSAAAWRNIAALWRAVRARSFDAVIDTQGLFFKSALIARFARGRRHGYDAQSVREWPASLLYDVRHPVAWNQHAIARNRLLTGHALDYTPAGAPDFGLDRARLAEPGTSPYAVLLHATARASKLWPEDRWRLLAAALATDIDLVIPFGTDVERARAERIAAVTSRARVPERAPLDRMARLIAGAAFVVGVDTGLLHVAAALGVPLVAIFAASEPGLTGPVGAGPIAVVGGPGAPPSAAEVTAAVGRLLR
jgi:heptosyltransferase-1